MDISIHAIGTAKVIALHPILGAKAFWLAVLQA